MNPISGLIGFLRNLFNPYSPKRVATNLEQGLISRYLDAESLDNIVAIIQDPDTPLANEDRIKLLRLANQKSRSMHTAGSAKTASTPEQIESSVHQTEASTAKRVLFPRLKKYPQLYGITSRKVAFYATGALAWMCLIFSGFYAIEVAPIAATIFIISLYSCIALANHRRLKPCHYHAIWMAIPIGLAYGLMNYYLGEEPIYKESLTVTVCFFFCFIFGMLVIWLMGKVMKRNDNSE
jgi:hypothetical protein